ncbi:hypothetical protein BP5796_01236 [Coleophoma crateriformis]|uniref:F-box domain-containing protein n=1 Tax=Coleophoma crateriformis TaxID=565419 RepID=A0A3D8SZV5_9HELO|nr:hypothetical protein BP5796_01236 [Coleophoma crateriformis]
MADPGNMQPAQSPQSKKHALHLHDLPKETQQTIFSFVSCADLVSLCLVSKRTRDLATQRLYQAFHIVFPDDDDPSNDSQIDGLAAGLDTLATSDYNYAQHLKEIALYAFSGGEKGERAYTWDIRVELGRQVFKALHQIPSLTNVHIRMHAGPSLYEPPPAIRSKATSLDPKEASKPASRFGAVDQLFDWHEYDERAVDTRSIVINPSTLFPSGISFVMNQPKRSANGLTLDPPTISGFRNLKKLSILDMDTLDYITELKTCLRNSSHTLSKLELSFSTNLANQARKPPAETSDDDDSDQDADDFGGTNDDVSGPAQAFRAQEERKLQEGFLGQIFGSFDIPQNKADRVPEKPKSESRAHSKAATNIKMQQILELFTKTMQEAKSAIGLQDHQDLEGVITKVIDEINKSIDKNVESHFREAQSEMVALEIESETEPVGSQETQNTSGSAPSPPVDSAFPTTTEEEPSLAEIKVDEPEGDLVIEEGDQLIAPAETAETISDPSEKQPERERPPSPKPNEILKKGSIQYGQTKKLVMDLKSMVASGHPLLDGEGCRYSVEDLDRIHSELCSVEGALGQPQSESSALDNKKDRLRSSEQVATREYIRKTRGLSLTELSIFLIPIKASVFSKAINLSVLQSITLLNVGAQAPFWTMLKKENDIKPLGLHKIHTDNVTSTFLTFVSQLEKVTELYLLERKINSKVESFAAKTITTITSIRRLALKKHAGTLKVLRISNDSSYAWDVDAKTIALLCQKAKKMEELAMSLNVRVMHNFLQALSGLASLRALHFLHLRTDDLCMWVVREARKFTIDTISQIPSCKIEYVALEKGLERLIRCKPQAKAKTISKKKSKKAVPNLDPIPGFPIPEEESVGESESDGDDDKLTQPQLRIESSEGMPFHDAVDVKIFKNGIMFGRL